MNKKDGLYRIVYKSICCGFVIKNGIIVKQAPILKNNKWLLKFAKLIKEK